VPQQGAEISDEELIKMARAAGMEVEDTSGERWLWQAWEDEILTFARTVWARAQAARPAIQPVPVSEPVGFFPVEYADADGEGIRILMEPADETGRVCWTVRNSRHVNPYREFATPEEAYAAHRTAADQQEGRGDAAGEVQP
jgi:hypothetical protein